MTASPTERIVRPRARLLYSDGDDGDTYALLLDVFNTNYRTGAVTAEVRLRDYSARELKDTASTDPKQLGRVSGPDAKNIARTLLANATEILVELKGRSNRERIVAWVWVDGQSFGELLATQHAVVHGSFMG